MQQLCIKREQKQYQTLISLIFRIRIESLFYTIHISGINKATQLGKTHTKNVGGGGLNPLNQLKKKRFNFTYYVFLISIKN